MTTPAYASVSRFRINDTRPYIYRTHDSGKTWKLITAGLPEGTGGSVREDPLRRACCSPARRMELGVFLMRGSLAVLQLNLPHTSIAISGSMKPISSWRLTGARSGFWTTSVRCGRLPDLVAESEGYLFKPAPAYRVSARADTDTPLRR